MPFVPALEACKDTAIRERGCYCILGRPIRALDLLGGEIGVLVLEGLSDV